MLFRHHGDRYNNNMISLYDLQFNRKFSIGGGRAWDRNRLSWLPEVSDHPVQGNVRATHFLQIKISTCNLKRQRTRLCESTVVLEIIIRVNYTFWPISRLQLFAMQFPRLNAAISMGIVQASKSIIELVHK